MVSIKRKSNGQFPPLLHLTYDLQQVSDKALMPRAGLGLGQVRILSGLHPSAPVSQKELALGLHQTEANVSRQLRLLKRQGLVSVTKNKKDSRARDVKLTAKGSKKYQLAVKILQDQQKVLQKLLGTKERAAFNNGVEHLASGLGAKHSQSRKILG